MPRFAGRRFGRYELVAPLGAGGMGEVWRAQDHDLHRQVAIKFLPERFTADPGRLLRFAQEARAASSLNHPNIVTIHEIGEDAGERYIVMELVRGRTLRERAQEARPLDARQLLEIGCQLADGLAKAHAAGIVHRDLKPDNVMVTDDGLVKILDFGLAKLRGEGSAPRSDSDSSAPTWPGSPSPQTALGALVGTVGYMSPEQASGRACDHRADQFTLGAILYELASGRQAFRADTPAQTLAAIIEKAPPPITGFDPRLLRPLRRIVEERCLAKDPADRYASTEELARELRELRDRVISASGALAAEDGPVPRRRGRTVLAAAAVVLAVLAAAGFGAWRWLTRAPTTGDRQLVVAVLPLTNLSGDAQDDAAATGIAQVVVDSLSRVEGLHVLPRTASLAYQGRKTDLSGVARELDAGYLVDGVIQRSEQRLRVSLTLVRTESGTVEWGETFDGAFPRVFELQSQVANAVARAARLRVSPQQVQRLSAQPTENPAAWEGYTTALALLDRQDRPGNVAAAVARLDGALRADPRFAQAHALMARACLARYDETGEASWADRGSDAAHEALRLAPQHAQVRGSLAAILASRGRLPEALDELQRAVAQDPGSDEIRRLYSRLLVSAGQPEAALVQAAQAVALRPRTADNHLALGWVHFSAGRWSEAAAAYRRVTELQSDGAWGFQMLGTALHMAGRLDEAVGPYQEAIRRAPDARAWANLGAVHYAKGRTDQAVRAYEEAARLEPASGTIRRSLGDARARAGALAGAKADWRAAVELSRAALRVNPRDPRQLKNQAICLAKLERREEALRASRSALEAGPANADAHYGAAVVHALLGDARGSIALLEKALDLGASLSLAQEDDDLAVVRARPEFRQLQQRAVQARAGR